MRILLTGSTGFIGRRILPLLSTHDVFCLTRNNITEISRFKPEIVIHLAWPGVYGKERYDSLSQDEGFRLTLRLICDIGPDCLRWIGVGSQAELSLPDSPYGCNKLLACHATEKWARQNKISFAWARLYSVYGPGETNNSFLSYVIRELLSNRDVALTDQNIPWDFLYVDDATRAIAMLAFEFSASGVFDIASDEMIYTQDAAVIIKNKINKNVALKIGSKPRREIEICKIPRADTSLMSALGWKPLVSFDKGTDLLIRSIRDTQCDL